MTAEAPMEETLCSLAGWLSLNTIRSEKIMFQQLLLQSTANVWRKNAWTTLLVDAGQGADPSHLEAALNSFVEPINFQVSPFSKLT